MFTGSTSNDMEIFEEIFMCESIAAGIAKEVDDKLKSISHLSSEEVYDLFSDFFKNNPCAVGHFTMSRHNDFGIVVDDANFIHVEAGEDSKFAGMDYYICFEQGIVAVHYGLYRYATGFFASRVDDRAHDAIVDLIASL